MIKDRTIDLIALHDILPLYITEDFEVLKRTVPLCSEVGLRALDVLNCVPNTLDLFVKLKQFVGDHIPEFQMKNEIQNTVEQIQVL